MLCVCQVSPCVMVHLVGHCAAVLLFVASRFINLAYQQPLSGLGLPRAIRHRAFTP